MIRFHHNRTSPAVRDSFAENHVSSSDFIAALFVVEDRSVLHAVPGLDGASHTGIDRIVEAVDPLLALGVDKVLLFGVSGEDAKTREGRSAWEGDPVVAQAIRVLKKERPELTIFTDVCLCAYTDHGHCGIPNARGDGTIDNDATLPFLAQMALRHAEAGADWVAPSAMMDGQVAAIREILDQNGFDRPRVQVLGYSAKFASGLYGPFRGAAASSPGFGDRKTYQMDWRNGTEALEEIRADLAEGADAVMVKPALNYLDILARARETWPSARIAAYHTSGEYMALKAAAAAGVLDGPRVLSEQLHSIKRAGADWIIGYAAAEFLQQEHAR